MASNLQELQICCMCRHVRDSREVAYERWVTKQTYREGSGIDPAACRLIYTYCRPCHNYVSAIQAA